MQNFPHPLVRVVNIKNHNATNNDQFIGRPTVWGNPFRIGPDGNREQVVEKFKQFLETSDEPQARFMRDNIKRLAGRNLVCFCHPLPCHGHVLADYLRKELMKDQ